MKKMNQLKKCKELSYGGIAKKFLQIMLPLQMLFRGVTVHALSQTKLVSGTKQLIDDATSAALLVEAVLIGFLSIKEGIMYQQAEPEDKKIHKKNIKSILVVGILIVSATAVIKVVLGYYQ